MTRAVVNTTSPRHGFKFNKVPTIKGCMYGGGDIYPNFSGSAECAARSVDEDYAAVLDCVFEMADQVCNCNGVTPAQAIETVLKDEGWRILPSHKKEIINRITGNA